MSVSDETLAAYVDGELDPAACAEIEEAVRRDPSIAQRIARYRSLRNQLQAAYADELERAGAGSPARGAANPRASPVTCRRRSPDRTKIGARDRRRVSLALFAGGERADRGRRGISCVAAFPPASMENVDGTLIARGALATGLSDQLSGPAPSGSGPSGSHRDGSGSASWRNPADYCRTFSLSIDAGLACRRAGRWESWRWRGSSRGWRRLGISDCEFRRCPRKCSKPSNGRWRASRSIGRARSPHAAMAGTTLRDSQSPHSGYSRRASTTLWITSVCASSCHPPGSAFTKMSRGRPSPSTA